MTELGELLHGGGALGSGALSDRSVKEEDWLAS